jgi:hypothetical protein
VSAAVVVRRAIAVALALAVVATVWLLNAAQTRPAPRISPDAAVGPVGWPFQGTASVAAAHLSDAVRALQADAAPYETQARSQGGALHLGTPHALFATTYRAGGLDVVVTVVPVSGVSGVVGLAGLYGTDGQGHASSSLELVGAGDATVSGEVKSHLFADDHPVTVVVGGPRAGGLLVDVDGGKTGPSSLPDSQVVSDPRGISWIYRSVRPTPAQPHNGVLSVTDGNGDIQHLLYYGPPAAGPVTDLQSS